MKKIRLHSSKYVNSKQHEKYTKFLKKSVKSRILKCGLCDEIFKKKFEYKRHLRSHMKIYKCKYCYESFAYMDLKDDHESIDHKAIVHENSIQNAREYRNQELMKVDLKVALEEYDSEHTGHRNKQAMLGNFSCELCGEKVLGNRDSEDHLCIKKSIKKELPDFEYANDQIIKMNNTGEYQQPKCDSKYNLRQELLNQNLYKIDMPAAHIDTTNNIEYAENINKCELCDEQFYTLHDYKSHLKTHNVFVDNDHNYTIEVEEQKEVKPLDEMNLKSNYELVLVQGTDTYVLAEVSGNNQETIDDNIDEVLINEQDCNDYVEVLENDSFPEETIEDTTCICEICGEHFVETYELKAHVAAHAAANIHNCKICHRDFRRKSDLKKHISIHLDEHSYSCEICGKGFTQSATKERHMKIHDNERIVCNLSVCDLCGESFDEIDELKVHIKEHTGEAIECEFCGEYISNLGCYKSHMQMHILEELFVCNICHKTFNSNEEYKRHMDRHQPAPEILCIICGKSFRSTHNLKIHMRIHTMSRPYKCEVCGKTFTQTSSHSIHMRIHTGERPYKCEICGKSFSQTGHHKTHMRIHTGLRPFQCNLCSKTFSDYGNYIKHTRLHTGDQPYKCVDCNKGFSRKKRYELHLLTHENLST